MLKMIIKNSAGVQTNQCKKETEQQLAEWYEQNKSFFPENHTKEILSAIDEELDFLRDQESDEAIELGTAIIKEIRKINRRKLKLGLWTQAKFNQLLSSQTAAQIERALWNGSLSTAGYLLTNMSDFYSDIEIAAIIQKINQHEEKWKDLI